MLNLSVCQIDKKEKSKLGEELISVRENNMCKGWWQESPHVFSNYEQFHSALGTSGGLIGSEVENYKTEHEDTCMLCKVDLTVNDGRQVLKLTFQKDPSTVYRNLD